MDYYRALLRADYERVTSAESKAASQLARSCFFAGNDLGFEAMAAAVFDLAANAAGMLVYAVAAATLSPWLPVLMALSSVASVVAGLAAQRFAQGVVPRWLERLEQFNYLARQCMDTAMGKDVRLYGMEGWLKRELMAATRRTVALRDEEGRRNQWAAVVSAASALVRDLVSYALLIAGVFAGSLGLPEFLFAAGMVAGFGTWAPAAFEALARVHDNSRFVGAWRTFEASLAPAPRPCAAVAAPGAAHSVTFDHVSFAYAGGEPVLRDVSLTVHAGERVALVGKNGAGKSTLVKLACGLLEPTEGRVLLDGRDIAQVDRAALFEEFSVVFQDAEPFSFSLEDNVTCRYGAAGTAGEKPVRPVTDTEGEKPARPAPDLDSRLERCLDDAGLLDKVRRLPRGARTYLNRDLCDDGVQLSGGEVQRLMLARALYKDAPVVILDEPTAALDPLAEARMYERYAALTSKKTSVFISHRLSSTRFCDRILLLDGGRVAEEGTHDELMAAGGAYARMFAVQARYYQDGDKDAGPKCGQSPRANVNQNHQTVDKIPGQMSTPGEKGGEADA